jgi:hypothetical protein
MSADGGHSPVSPAQNSTAEKKNQRPAAVPDLARRAPGHPRTHRSITAAAMPPLQKMASQRSGVNKSAKVVLECRNEPCIVRG